MWTVSEHVFGDRDCAVNMDYNNMLTAEKMFEKLRKNWKEKHKYFKVKLELKEDGVILKEREFLPDEGEDEYTRLKNQEIQNSNLNSTIADKPIEENPVSSE